MTTKKLPQASSKRAVSIVRSSAAEYLTFVAASGQGGVEAVYADESIWVTQKMMGTLYDVETQTINYHLKKVFGDSELEEASVIRKFRITAADGKNYDTQHYSLPAIIAVGYKVNSERAVQFRKWATGIIEQFTIKAYVMDDERIKAGGSILTDQYFEEQLQRVREIRISERKFYQKITDIYATAIDYDVTAQATKRFFATVQNKLHWAIHGQTAAELIACRADAAKPHMGLSTWKNAPHGPIRKADVTVAKNYLTEEEIRELNRIVTMYLDYAEDQARRHKPMHMADWVKKLDAFLQFNERNILTHAGTVSHELAQEHAHREFEKYDTRRRQLEAQQPASDFDQAVERVKRLHQNGGKQALPSAPKPLATPGRTSGRKKKGGGE